MSTKIHRIKLIVAYDGSDFSGWAAQTGLRTVQSTLKIAVRQVSGEDCEIIGASRTDGGAHAMGQVCHVDVNAAIPIEKWASALNRVLPSDVAILQAVSVEDRFHARFSAFARHYRYRIQIGPRDVTSARFHHSYGRPLDAEAMNRAAQILKGEHDFRALSEELEPEKSAVREIFQITATRRDAEIHIDVLGSAFVRGMMRRISGLLLDIGRGKRPPEHVTLLLDPRQREQVQWPEVLPAKGLTLLRIFHGNFRIDWDEQPSEEEKDSLTRVNLGDTKP